MEADSPREQVREVLAKTPLEPSEEKYFSRCLLCNEILLPVPKEEVEGRVPDFIYRAYDSFHACPRCRRVYWPGTHLQRMKKEVDRILSGEDKANGEMIDRATKGVCRRKEGRGKMTLWELIKKGAEEGLEAMKDGVSVFMAEAGKTSQNPEEESRADLGPG